VPVQYDNVMKVVPFFLTLKTAGVEELAAAVVPHLAK
jgi:hypothetical protein